MQSFKYKKLKQCAEVPNCLMTSQWLFFLVFYYAGSDKVSLFFLWNLLLLLDSLSCSQVLHHFSFNWIMKPEEIHKNTFKNNDLKITIAARMEHL